MAKRQEHYTGVRATKHGIVVESRTTDIVLSTTDVIQLIELLVEQISPLQEEDAIAPRQSTRPLKAFMATLPKGGNGGQLPTF